MARTPHPFPTQKVTAVGIAGAVSILVVWALRQFAQVEVPLEVGSAFTMILTFLAGYITPPASGEVSKSR